MTTVAAALADRSDVPVWGWRGWALFTAAVLFVWIAFHGKTIRDWWNRDGVDLDALDGKPPRPDCSRRTCPGVGTVWVLAPSEVGLKVARVCVPCYQVGLRRGWWPGRLASNPFDREAAELVDETERWLWTGGRAS